MVERYLLKKSLMKPLQVYSELKRLKSLEYKPSDLNPAQVKELKAQFFGLEQLLVQQPSNGASTKSASTNGQSAA